MGLARNLKGRALNLFDRPVVVLCYHRVTAGSTDINSIAVSPENFGAQIGYLKKHFHLLRFDEDWMTPGKPAAVVTFDDGYADNLTTALPILEEAGVPATFFISTGEIGTGGEFWWDALERILMREGAFPATLSLRDAGPARSWPTATAQERTVLYRDLHQLFMNCSGAQRGGWLAQVAAWAGQSGRGDDSNRLLTVDELRSLAAGRGVTIGAHTVSHPRLSSLSEEEQRFEIVESGRQLEEIIGKEVTVFAYPFGKKIDYDSVSVRLCREAGYTRAAAAFPGEAHRWTDPFQIPRHFVYNWDRAAFAAKLKRLGV